MSSPDRPCAQGLGTMRRLRQMRFPLGIDQDSAKNCDSRGKKGNRLQSRNAEEFRERSSGPGGPRGLLPWGPGKEVALPPPPPLRTTRECFHSCSSSLSNAPCGTRLPLPQGCRVRTAQPSLRGEPSRYRPGADTHHGRPHQQVVAAVICLPPEAVDQVFS